MSSGRRGGRSRPPLEIELLPAAAASDRDLVSEIVALVERVDARTTTTDVTAMIAAWQIAVARLDGRVVGTARVRQLDAGTGHLGVLVVEPTRRGEGVGGALVAFAERLSRQRDLATMRLELPSPHTSSHPVEQFVHAWYTRAGYRPVRSRTSDDGCPHEAPPCAVVVYDKNLAVTAGPAASSPGRRARRRPAESDHRRADDPPPTVTP